jgi:ankyrin repeat protein
MESHDMNRPVPMPSAPLRLLVSCAFALVLSMPPVDAAAQPETDPSPNAQLLVAARTGQVARVKELLAQGAIVDSRNRVGKTPLFIACEKGNTELGIVLIEAKADVNLASVDHVTPLMAASYSGDAELVKRLLAAGARVDAVDRMNKSAPVYAAGQGHATALEALLASGLDVNATYEHQLTLLMWAAGQGHADAVRLLLSRGARPDMRDDRGMTAFDIARGAGQEAMAQSVGLH